MNTVLASNAATSGTYASKSTTVGMCVRIVPKGEEMKKRKKLNFWRLLPKLSIATASVFAVYIAYREYTGTGSISGYSFVVPLAIVVYFIVTQAVECVFEGKGKD